MKRNIAHILKRAAALVLAGCLAIPLTACQSSPAASADPSGGETQAAETLPAETDIWLKVKEEEYGTDGTLKTRRENEYNEYGQIIRTVAYNADGEEIGRFEYTYDGDHKLVSHDFTWTYTYTKSVQKVEQTVYYDAYGHRASYESTEDTVYSDGSYPDTTKTYEGRYFCYPNGDISCSAARETGENLYDVSTYANPFEMVQTYEGDLLVKEINDTETQSREYEYDENGNLIKITTNIDLKTDEPKSYDTLYTYEERTCQTLPSISLPETEEMDVIAKADTYDPSGEYLYAYYYGYDAYGRQIGASYSKNAVQDEYNEYDDNGQVIRVWANGLVADMTYNDQGQRIREDYRSEPDGEILFHSECIYDEDGNLSQMISHGDQEDYSEAEGRTQNYEYDENGNLLFCRLYDGSGTLLAYDAYTYGEDGKIAQITTYDGDDNISYTTYPKYETISVFAAKD